MASLVKYLGDGLYARAESDGTVTLSTQRTTGEHYVVLEPRELAVLEAWLRELRQARSVAP